MGAGFAYMTLRLGGIEFSTGVHATNNILIVLFIEPLTLKTAAAPTDLTTGRIIEDICLIAGYILITEAVRPDRPPCAAGPAWPKLPRCPANRSSGGERLAPELSRPPPFQYPSLRTPFSRLAAPQTVSLAPAEAWGEVR